MIHGPINISYVAIYHAMNMYADRI